MTKTYLELASIRQKRVPIKWTYKGVLTFETPKVTIAGSAASSIRLLSGDAQGTIENPSVRDEVVRTGVNGTVRFGGGAARHSFAYVGGSRNGRRYFKFLVQDLRVIKRQATAYITRETLLGTVLGSPGHETIAARLETTAFGRKVLICGYSSNGTSAKTDSIQIIYHGTPFSDQRRRALLDLLRFLAGSRGNSNFVEVFDAKGRLMRFSYRNHGVASSELAIQPIDMNYASGRPASADLARQFGTMVEKMLALRKKNPVRSSAVLHHYLDATTNPYPTSRLRNLSVAVEALAGLILNRQTKPTYIMDNTVFDAMMKPILKAYDSSFDEQQIKAHLASTWKAKAALKELRKKIGNANRQGPRSEVLSALVPLGVNVTDIERTVFGTYRNGITHDGHYGDENETRNLRRNDLAASLMMNLFNRSMLALLEYDDRVPGSGV